MWQAVMSVLWLASSLASISTRRRASRTIRSITRLTPWTKKRVRVPTSSSSQLGLHLTGSAKDFVSMKDVQAHMMKEWEYPEQSLSKLQTEVCIAFDMKQIKPRKRAWADLADYPPLDPTMTQFFEIMTGTQNSRQKIWTSLGVVASAWI